MKFAAIYLVALAMLASPVMALQRAAGVWTFSQSEILECDREGGCAPISREALRAIVERAFTAGVAAKCQPTV